MSRRTRYMTFLGVVIAVLVAFFALYDWAVFLFVPLPHSIAISAGAAMLTHVWTAPGAGVGRVALRSLSYVAAASCAAASVSYWVLWGKAFDYADTYRGVPARIENALEMSFAVATIALALGVVLAAFSMTLMKTPQAVAVAVIV